jgi:hypothetical protein
MIRIAGSPLVMRASILCDMATALGIIFLGAVLYVTLRKHGEMIALTGFGFYILEAVLIAASKLDAFSLLRMSQEYAAAGRPDALPDLAKIASESEYFTGMTLAMVAFCPGALLLYYLLFKSRIIPCALSLWGFLAVFPCAIGTLSSALGYKLPIFIFLPYMPFKFTVGVWILIRGIKEAQNGHDDRS